MSSSSEERAFPFILGFPRSGTTLLRAMLNAHPEFAVPPESHFIVPLEPNGRTPGKAPFESSRFLDQLSADRWFLRWGLSLDDVERALDRVRPRTYADAVREVFAAYARLKRKPRYADKTPDYLAHINRLAALFPEGRFIHIIRDGRDIWLSHRDVGWYGSGFRKAEHWQQQVRQGMAAGRRLGPSRYVEIRYDRLIDDPPRELERMTDLIGVSYDARMLSYHRDAQALAETSPRPEIHRGIALPPTAGMRNWRTEMPASERAGFQAVAKPLLRELGFEVPRVSGRSRARIKLFAAVRIARIRHAVQLRTRLRVLRSHFGHEASRSLRSTKRAPSGGGGPESKPAT